MIITLTLALASLTSTAQAEPLGYIGTYNNRLVFGTDTHDSDEQGCRAVFRDFDGYGCGSGACGTKFAHALAQVTKKVCKDRGIGGILKQKVSVEFSVCSKEAHHLEMPSQGQTIRIGRVSATVRGHTPGKIVAIVRCLGQPTPSLQSWENAFNNTIQAFR